MNVLGLLIATVLANPLASAEPTVAPATAALQDQAGEEDPNRLICRRAVRTGSRMGNPRECKTAAEWETERAKNVEADDVLDVQGYMPTTGDCGGLCDRNPRGRPQ